MILNLFSQPGLQESLRAPGAWSCESVSLVQAMLLHTPGYTTWFDDNQSKLTKAAKTRANVDASLAVIVFVTKGYSKGSVAHHGRRRGLKDLST